MQPSGPGEAAGIGYPRASNINKGAHREPGAQPTPSGEEVLGSDGPDTPPSEVLGPTTAPKRSTGKPPYMVARSTGEASQRLMNQRVMNYTSDGEGTAQRPAVNR